MISPFARPFWIGRVLIPNRVVVGPMAGVTTSAYRRHLKNHGAGLVTTEMVSAAGLLHGNRRTQEYLQFEETERPLAAQLFGSDPHGMTAAVERVLSLPRVPDFIDINFGCPVRKVMKTGAGAALLGDSERAVAVARAAARAASQAGVPVTVKLRSGLQPGDETVVDLAPRLEEAGVASLTVHARAASQFYSGVADHRVSARVVAAVKLPVVASGDAIDRESALRVMETSGAAALMLARGLQGNPWLIRDLLTGVDHPRPVPAEVVSDLRSLLGAAREEMGDVRAARWIRRHVRAYLRPLGIRGPELQDLLVVADAEILDQRLARLT